MIDCAHAGCRRCPSSSTAVVPRPPDASRVAIVLDAPSDGDVARATWLTGPRGGANAMLVATLAAIDIDVNDLYICSALNCRPNTKKQAMVKNAMLACRERLVDELKQAGIEKVLCLGAVGYSALMSSKKLLAVTKIRGRWQRAFGMDVMATLPPGFMFGPKSFDWFRDFAYDIEKFFTTDGLQPWPEVDLWVPETIKEAGEAFEFLHEHDFVSIDLETTGLSPIDNDVIAAGFGVLHGRNGDATTVVLSESLLGKTRPWRLVSQLLNSPVDVPFHNAKFDLQFLKKHLVAKGLKYAPKNVHCTMMLHYTLDERPVNSKFKSHKLEAIARVRYDAPDYGIDIRKFLIEWEKGDAYDRDELRKRLHVYLGLDCYYTARLFPDLWNEALEEDEELVELYESLLMPATVALADIEYHGVLVDRPMFEEMNETLQGKENAVMAKLQRRANVPPDFNPGSPKQVEEYLYGTLGLPFGIREENGKVYHSSRRGGLQEGPTAAPVIKNLGERFPEHLEVIDEILDYRTFTKTIGTYVKGMLDRTDSDGRLRTSFNLAGTGTGRLSSSNPNLQNVPDASHIGFDIRAGFYAKPGNVFVEADYKQLEVRIAAELSGDPVMFEVFASGRDPHQEIAYSIYHKEKSQISKYERWLAKNILFGLLYGRGYESVATGPEQEDIARHGGKRWSIDEVKSYYDSLLATWERFAEWQSAQKRNAYATGLIKTRSGRRRRFQFIPKHDGGFVGRAGFNTPIQGYASDFTLYALIRLHATLPEGAHIVLTIHDELVVECREDQAEEVAELMRYTMEEDTLHELSVPLKVDVDWSPRWGGKSSVDRDVITVEEA